jgi:hypothetical protein
MLNDMANEILPVVAGVVAGFLAFRVASPRRRRAHLVVLSVVFGLGASWTSGELGVSLAYALVDIGQVFVSGALTLAAAPLLQRGRRPVS